MPSAQPREMIYIGDPMCSWCWGFAPVVDKLLARFAPEVELRIIVGGLRPGRMAERMDAGRAAEIRSHWEHVQQASGQPFDFAFFERQDFLYDTEPPARAVTVVRALAPEQEFPYFKRMQRAFYADNRDITDPAELAALAGEIGLDEAQFRAGYDAEDSVRAAYGDFATAQQIGIRAFPSVVLRRGEKAAALTVGYQPYDKLEPLVAAFFRPEPA